jgi:FixJ family two-component response regulator
MGKRIIGLDDDAAFRAAVERTLKANGFTAEGYDTVEEFLTDAPLHDASCLILDINLNGRCGIELKRQLARSGVSLPVIFITGDERDATRQAALEAGCVAFLRKPFSSTALMTVIKQIDRTDRPS